MTSHVHSNVAILQANEFVNSNYRAPIPGTSIKQRLETIEDMKRRELTNKILKLNSEKLKRHHSFSNSSDVKRLALHDTTVFQSCAMNSSMTGTGVNIEEYNSNNIAVEATQNMNYEKFIDDTILSDDDIIDLHADDNEINLDENYQFEFDSAYVAFQSLNSFPRFNGWIIDSGASVNMTYDKSVFLNYTKENGKIFVATGKSAPIMGRGSIILSIDINGVEYPLKLDNVLHIPDLSSNLISTTSLNKANISILFHQQSCFFFLESKFRKVSYVKDGCNILKEWHNYARICVHEWHRRFSHRNIQEIRHQQSLIIEKCSCRDQCDSCVRAKMFHEPFKSSVKPDASLDVICADLAGPFPTQSISGAQYYLIIVDTYSDYTEIRFLRRKNDAIAAIIEFFEFIFNQLNRYPKVFRSDRGGEFLCERSINFFAKHGIRFELICPDTAAQNGIAERKNRTICDAIRANLYESKLPLMLWEEAAKHAVYSFNRLVRKGENKCPLEKFYNKKPVKNIVEFGAEVYIPTSLKDRRKFDEHAIVSRYLGVDNQSKGFRVWNGRRIIITRTVKEKLSSFIHGPNDTLYHESQPLTSSAEQSEMPLTDKSVILERTSLNDESGVNSNNLKSISTDVDQVPLNLIEKSSTHENQLRRSARIKENQEKFSLSSCILKAMHSSKCDPVVKIPNTFNEMLHSPEQTQWEAAMTKELKSMEDLNTFEL